jgi:hypothetical protein
MNDIKTLLWFLMIGGAGLGIVLYKSIKENELNKARTIGILAGLFFLPIFFISTLDIVRYQVKSQLEKCPQCLKTYEKEYWQLQTKVKTFCDEHKRASICKEK